MSSLGADLEVVHPRAPGRTAVVERALARVEWEPVVFAPAPRRLALARLRPAWPLKTLRLMVHRNRVFEPVASAMAAFGAYAGWRLDIQIGSYNDSIAAVGGTLADVELLWLDYARYDLESDALAAYVADRARNRVASSRVPVLVAGDDRPGPQAAALNEALAGLVAGIGGATFLDVRMVAERLEGAYRDERLVALGSSDLTDLGSLEIARDLAFRWLPAATRPRLKLIAVDLDNTLVDGVIGEDGVEGVTIGPGRSMVAKSLADLAAAGVLIALVTRNEPSDVEALFESRRDLALPRSSLFAVEAGWGPKSESLARIVARARIGMDSVLFIDDNPGELAAMVAAHPELQVLSAADADLVAAAVAAYPGLHGYPEAAEDGLRIADLRADHERQAAHAVALTDDEFLRSLGVVAELALDDPAAQERVASLSLKTNQFNTSLRRFSAVDVAERLASNDARIVTASVRDRLSDSGIVAEVISTREDGLLQVEEMAISCRALGRGLETRLLAESVSTAARSLGCDRVRFAFRAGPRNQPARDWLAGLLGRDPAEEPEVPLGRIVALLVPDPPFTISWSARSP